MHSIVLAPAQRSVVRLTGDRLDKRIERLRELIVAACAQCGRNRIPRIEASPTLAASLRTGLSDGAWGVAGSECRTAADEIQVGRAASRSRWDPKAGLTTMNSRLRTNSAMRVPPGTRVLRAEDRGARRS